MTWETLLMKRCYEVMEIGGEVRIQFCIRKDVVVPIVRVYPENQVICEEVKLDESFVK